MNFRYVARDPMGRKVQGEIDAKTPEQAAAELKGRALTILSLEAAGGGVPRSQAAPAALFGSESLAADLEAETDEKAGGEKTSSWGGTLWTILIIIFIIAKFLRACG